MKSLKTYQANVSNDIQEFKLRQIPMKLKRLDDPELGPSVVVSFGNDHGLFALLQRETIGFATEVADALEEQSGLIEFPAEVCGNVSVWVGVTPPSRHRKELLVKVAPPIRKPGFSIYMSLEEMTRFVGDIREFGEEVA